MQRLQLPTPYNLLIITLLMFISVVANGDNLKSKYMTVHTKHITPFINNLVDEANTQYGWDAGLVYQRGFNWNQSRSIIENVKRLMNKCWIETFLDSSSEKQITEVINAYNNQENQFLSRRVSSYKKALNDCTSKSGVYLKKSMNEIINGE